MQKLIQGLLNLNTKVNSQGLKMKLVAYRTRDDIDVRFEDGALVTGVRYRDFESGDIQH